MDEYELATLKLCDRLVEQLREAWNPAAPHGVERCYFKRYGPAGSGAIEFLPGRRWVTISPAEYENAPETRGEDKWTHRIIVQVVERYGDAGDPPTEWIDERTKFTGKYIVNGFDFSRGPPPWHPSLLTEDCQTLVLDLDKIMNGGKLFLSQVDFVFTELIPCEE